MGCSGRPKAHEIRADQKWDFISLSDFKSVNCLNGFAYAYLLGSLIVSIAVYGVDTFTAVNLLVFDRWSGKIDPAIPLNISKWIFSACIIASWVNLGYEYVRAVRVMKRGAVAESYLDPLAVRLQCIRWTKTGRGWRRFLVFAELTKSKKGAEYVALFTYFSFQAWIRIIFCQGPRQVVNALTLKAVFESKLIPTDGDDVGSALGEFFQKMGHLYTEDNQQAVILSGMLFTLVIWVFGALSLLLGVLFYILFLWHYIPNGDGGLSGFCEKKINKRLAGIVSAKVNKAIEEEERKRQRADAKALKKGEKPQFGRQATLPTMFDPKDPPAGSDKLPQMPMLNRNDTVSTLPQYTSRPGSPNSQPSTAVFELDKLENKRPPPGRSLTNTSFASNAPLISNASDMGYDRSDSMASTMPRERPGFPPPIRTMTGSSQNSQWSAGPRSRMPSDDRMFTDSPVSFDNRPGMPSHMSGNSQGSMDNYGRPGPNPNERSFTPGGPAPSMGRRTPFEAGSSDFQNSTPYPEDFPQNGPIGSQGSMSDYGRNSPAPSAMGRNPISPTGEYQAFNPNNRSASSTNPLPYPSGSTPGAQRRNMTEPTRGMSQDYPNERPGTSQSRRPLPNAQRGPQQDYFGEQPRSGTPLSGRQPPNSRQDYFGNERPGTSQSNRPPPSTTSGRGERQDYFGNERPNTAQSNRQPPSSTSGRGERMDYFGNERPGTAQSGRPPPSNLNPNNGRSTPGQGGFGGPAQGYAR